MMLFLLGGYAAVTVFLILFMAGLDEEETFGSHVLVIGSCFLWPLALLFGIWQGIVSLLKRKS